MSGPDQDVDRRYKVGRVLSEYDCRDLHDSLPGLWTGEDDDPLSLRELADRVNVALLREAMRGAGADPLEGEAENAYRLLTDDDVTAGVRTQQRNRLERAGVDLDQIEEDFVTHQAVHTYLTTALDVSKDDESDPRRKHERRIRRLRNRTAAVTEDSLTALDTTGTLSVGSPDVVVDVSVYCRECDTQYAFGELLGRGGCQCE